MAYYGWEHAWIGNVGADGSISNFQIFGRNANYYWDRNESDAHSLERDGERVLAMLTPVNREKESAYFFIPTPVQTVQETWLGIPESRPYPQNFGSNSWDISMVGGVPVALGRYIFFAGGTLTKLTRLSDAGSGYTLVTWAAQDEGRDTSDAILKQGTATGTTDTFVGGPEDYEVVDADRAAGLAERSFRRQA
jgi:hypothetical protein